MKTTKWLMVAAAAGIAQCSMAGSVNAQELYRVYLSAVSISTNAAGNLAYHELDNRSLIRQVADDQGITNLTGLRVVYDRTNDAVEVVSGTNDTVLAKPLEFADSVSLSNTNETRIQRFAWVAWQGSSKADGTLLASEEIGHAPTNEPAYFRLTGQLQFAVPGTGTNQPPVIYVGNLVASSNFERDEDPDAHGDIESDGNGDDRH